MEPEPLGTKTTATRKVRFTPKVPPRRATKPAETKIEVIDDGEAAQTRDLLRRVNEGFGREKPKAEKKLTPAQVAFGYGGAPTSIRSYGPPKGGVISNRVHALDSDDVSCASRQRAQKEYKEPWDYYSYYPVSLPLRRPYSGNPVLLDEEEFGKDSDSMTFNENCTNTATELGLMEQIEEASMLFLQLPAYLPMVKRSATSEGDEIANRSRSSRHMGSAEKACCLDELPAGFMGKMFVYKSGAVKMKLGDTLYDVCSGSDCAFGQDVVAINTEEKHCCIVGELSKRAIVTPDVDSILNTLDDMD